MAQEQPAANVFNPSKRDLLTLMSLLGEKPGSFRRAGRVMIAVANAHEQGTIDDQEFTVYTNGIANTLRKGAVSPDLYGTSEDVVHRAKTLSDKDRLLIEAGDAVFLALKEYYDQGDHTRIGCGTMVINPIENVYCVVTLSNVQEGDHGVERLWFKPVPEEENVTEIPPQPVQEAGAAKPPTSNNTHRDNMQALYDGVSDSDDPDATKEIAGAILYLMGYDPE